MKKILLPERTQILRQLDTYGRFVIGPLNRGYGNTLGNPLRRVLLSSIPGLSVVAVRIEGVLHEFSTIPGVLEDVTTIILNLKRLRWKRLPGFDGQTEVFLSVQGARTITGADLDVPSSVELVNPEQPIATLTEEDASLRMELILREGIGYVPSEDLLQEYPDLQLPQGFILMDALFTPVVKVNYQVEGTRVGTRTDYEKLILDVWTDGTVSPREAYLQAASILSESFARVQILEEVTEESTSEPSTTPAAGVAAPARKEVLDQPISVLELSSRILNSLRDGGVETLGQLVAKTPREVLAMKNLGEKSLAEIRSALAKFNLHLREDDDASS
ncbi:MAG: DNA-directed RNA polymerase subunit alpha [Candidatus Hydrothermae bacterium]|nr:DNA-directed RNA polymerase subunit alpha [Candidatus Hydrothermae bacterium]